MVGWSLTAATRRPKLVSARTDASIFVFVFEKSAHAAWRA
jgi:hypothetical protein